ncbi:MAG: CHAT domain-containing tetratricopeptide repeat protein [Cyanobacteria bacterium J06560_5]
MIDEQRLQAYVELVERVLGCPLGRESEVLQANVELVDKGLTTFMFAVVEQMELQGNSDANWLRQFATELEQTLEEKENILAQTEEARQFWLETLLLVAETQENPLQVYSIWQQQKDCFDETLLAALPAAITQLSSTDTEQQINIAEALFNFGNLINQFEFGAYWLNLEFGIAAYQQVLKIVSREILPIEWAQTTHNLALAYSRRIYGDKAENIEQAIDMYLQALSVITKEAMPTQWAQTTHNLALAYSRRIYGDKAENIEQAIDMYQRVLEIRTRLAMPENWATTMSFLANSYTNRVRGNKAENIEQAIDIYQQALTVATREAMPEDWATIMSNLAIAYENRIRGNKAENIEQAIDAYQQALTIITKESMPTDWATTVNNLGSAFSKRIRGDWSKSLEQAIDAFKQALSVRTRDLMPIEWAATTNNLASTYCDRIKGDRVENIEQAIDALKEVLSVTTQTAMPENWSTFMNNLALAYSKRIKGDRAENVEQAIDAYKQALSVRTKEAMPVEWADTQHNLGSAYSERIRGDKTENIEKAIDVYQQVLLVRTEEAMPVEWAQTMDKLASAYDRRIRGDRAENIEKAIDIYQQALSVRTEENMPIDWAHSMSNLSIAYGKRIRGDRAENIEKAIDICIRTLAIIKKESMPIDWARTMMNLAIAYDKRIRGDIQENVERAISAYEQSLTVITETIPVSWAQAMHNLATAYNNRVLGDRAENIEQAIDIYKQVLSVRTRDAMPIEWAQTMNNLAIAYDTRIRGSKRGNIKQAIDIYEQVLSIRTKDAMPIEWATTMSNLASSLKNQIGDNRIKGVKKAIASYRQALTVFDPELLPGSCRSSGYHLANLYSETKDWLKAVEAYQRALRAAENLYQSSNLLDSRALILLETADLPRRAAYAYARNGNFFQAIETIEQGRARGLSEVLDRDRVDLIKLQKTKPHLYSQYIATVFQLRNSEQQQRERAISGENNNITPEILRETAITLRQQLNALIKDIRKVPSYENFLSLPTFEEVAQTVRDDCPLVYLLSTPGGSLALIVTSQDIQSIWLDSLTEEQLIELLDENWFSAYSQSQSDHKSWFNAIDSVTRQLWEPLMQPLTYHLKAHNFNQVILIPTGYLSFLPLHAAWTEDENRPTKRRYALDDIHFTYVPSAKSLTAARTIAHRPQPDSILAIDNPGNDLPNSEREVNAAVSGFRDRTLLRHHEATVAAVKAQLAEAAIAHFSCHGTANLTEPLNSGLLMSDSLLTLKDIFALNLAETGGLRLAILSACETGLQGIENADEAISLPTGLLQAGVAAVISSLWSVSDLSTMILLIRFYNLWRTKGLEISQALRQAQQWVRDTTNGEKAAYFKDFVPTQSTTRMPASVANHLYKSLILSDPNARDFSHPFHWAAFTYVGV